MECWCKESCLWSQHNWSISKVSPKYTMPWIFFFVLMLTFLWCCSVLDLKCSPVEPVFVSAAASRGYLLLLILTFHIESAKCHTSVFDQILVLYFNTLSDWSRMLALCCSNGFNFGLKLFLLCWAVRTWALSCIMLRRSIYCLFLFLSHIYLFLYDVLNFC